MKPLLFIETYGCQMNFADSEILVSILKDQYDTTQDYAQADLILVNTCSIRDHAEQRVFNRLKEFAALKKKRLGMKLGLVGCMAERLKEQLLDSDLDIDLVVGPDAYRSLPRLLSQVEAGQKGIDTLLSEDETYEDILPVRLGTNRISAFISIMRGCQNYCSYCVVPYTRGKERSRDAATIVNEARSLVEQGYKEVTLLGQNVNSYKDGDVNFAELMRRVASVSPLLRIRFSTSHPKDLSDELIAVMAAYPNICRSIHLPVQSGSSVMLKKMNRKYDREWYLDRIRAIRKAMPDCGISTDIIAGFCGETEEDHKQTLSLMEEVGYDFAFMFKYSERPGTFASRHYPDDIPEEVKLRRLNEIINLQQSLSHESNKRDVGKRFEILVEGESKKNKAQYFGRNSQNKVIVFDNPALPDGSFRYQVGDYAMAEVLDCTPATLLGRVL
ncbi:MAG: tRNA (N6-isopentenyl adenosine(37)-C2)-methylthiotransferase MiaB [Bacteroidetes bacterium]|uniref:tRNA-2-methylthio-N(6)-dimethylallyladenosine synthase n=1 Tax=Candidatus Pullibacteroides excrementavium TaxID=2840905 RepID=A0A9D9DSN6_9BACT|nr:tRNA (N6-isopentenyl adenosine(37)-C2)-methylthiotransferase MiaB [Candidatus Pullibacteroides excrementavium]